MLYKYNLDLLSVLIKVRFIENYTEPYIMPNIGESGEVQVGLKDKNKGSFMIALAHQARLLPILGIVSTLSTINIPPPSSFQPKVYPIRTKFQNLII